MSLLSSVEFQQKVNSFQVPHLKDALKALGLSTSMNKPQLRERLLQAFERNPQAACGAVQGVDIGAPKLVYHAPPPLPASPAYYTAFEAQLYAAPASRLYTTTKPMPRTAAIASVPPSITPVGFAPPLSPMLVHQLEQLQIDSHQSLMDQCRIVGSLLVDKVTPRINTLCTLALNEQERHGLFVAQPSTHYLKCRFVLYSPETRQFTLTNMWPTGCSLQINSQLLFDTCPTPAAMIRPMASPLPLLDLTQLPLHPSGAAAATATAQYNVSFSAQRKATNVQWFVILFTLRKKPQDTILNELTRNSPSLLESTRRMLSTFDSEVACIDPITIRLRDPVSMGLISVPVRSRVCSHLQCFDFATHLEINTKARNPKWKCPTCSQDASVRLLVVDQWFQAVLDSRNAQGLQRCFQVLVKPGGETEFILEDEGDDDSEEEEAPSAAKRFQPATPPPVLPLPSTPAAAATSQLGVSRDQPILLLDDDDALF